MALDLTVPEKRIDLVQEIIGISNTVRSVPHIHACRLHNWIAGRPATIVPSFGALRTIATTKTSDFCFWSKPRYQDVSYRYSLLLTAEAPTTADVSINGSSVGTGFEVTNRRNALPLYFDQEQSSQGTTEAELKISVTAGASSVTVESLGIEALPRTRLTQDSNDLGADRLKLLHRLPIGERNFASNFLDYQDSLRDAARRLGSFHYSFGSDAPFGTTSTSYTGIFNDDVSILGRYIYNGDTTRELEWRVKCYASDNTTSANIRVSNNAGTDVIAMPTGTTSATWLPTTAGAASTFDVDAEDNTEADGLPSSATDDHTFDVQRTAGPGTVYIESISAWEA